MGALLLTSAALTIRALAADRAAKASAERTLDHLASVAAWETARHLAEDLVNTGRMSTAPAARLNGRIAGEAPSAERLFAQVPACACPDRVELVGYFDAQPFSSSQKIRLTGSGWLPDDSAVVADVTRAFSGNRRQALDTVRMQLHEGFEVRVLADRPGVSRLLFTQPVYAPDGRLLSLYGALVSPSATDAFFAKSIDRAPLLPESIVENTPRDSLLQVAVLAGESTAVFRTRASAALTGYVGHNPIGPMAPGIVVEARLLSPASAISAGALTRRAMAPVLLFVVTSLLTLGIGWAFLRHMQLDSMRSEFMAGVAHEFHTPLALISAYAQTSANGRANDDRERRQFMDLIVRESQRLSHLVDNVQRVASSARDEPVRLHAVVSLSNTVAEACRDFSVLAAASATSITSDLQPDLRVIGDPAAIRNALFNVLDNAVRYGGAGRAVHVKLVSAGAEAAVTIDDEGQGIEAEDRERVFERFVRLSTALGSDAIAGTGIGLSIVRDVMTQHKGHVAIERAPTGGARVRLAWPVADA